MPQPVKHMVRRMIRATGFDVVRVPVSPEPRAPAERGQSGTSPGSEKSCIPGQRDFKEFQPWPIPADLRARTEPWARELVKLYERPASWPSCVSPETGMFIHALVRNLRPRVVVETGTCHAASTMWIAAALQLSWEAETGSGVVHTFDDFLPPRNENLAKLPLFQNRLKRVQARVRRSGLEGLIRIHVGDSAANITAFRRKLDEAGGVQLAFIDGDHSPEGVRRDFEAVEPSLNIGGYVLLHDVFLSVCDCVGPRWLADNIGKVGSGRYQVCDVYTAPLNYGLTLMRRVG